MLPRARTPIYRSLTATAIAVHIPLSLAPLGPFSGAACDLSDPAAPLARLRSTRSQRNSATMAAAAAASPPRLLRLLPLVAVAAALVVVVADGGGAGRSAAAVVSLAELDAWGAATKSPSSSSSGAAEMLGNCYYAALISVRVLLLIGQKCSCTSVVGGESFN